MIVDDFENADDFEPGIDSGPSKSQRKRDALEVRALGEQLAGLGSGERARVPLPDDIIDAIAEYNRLSQRGARKRQLGLLAKRLRGIDLQPVRDALEAIRQEARGEIRQHHLAERWRERLLDDSSGGNELTAFLDHYPQTDRQQLRQLQRQARTEREQDKAPRAARQLFRVIRESIDQRADDDV